jgi:hypothetical protein
VQDLETGEDWFNRQSEAVQSELMGPGRYEAYKDGKFDFAAQSRQTEHVTWGHVHSTTPLKDLLGESE